MPEPVKVPRHPVAPEDVPSPYRELLVHDRDMTSTLARHHGGDIDLKLLEMRQKNRVYTRTVLLLCREQPVEYGWITIFLDSFPETAHELILEARHPLGWILEELQIDYVCDPSLFFRVEPDASLQALLKTKASTLYGRGNRITSREGEMMADVIEILPG